MKLKRVLTAALSVALLTGGAFAAEPGTLILPGEPHPNAPTYQVDSRNDDHSLQVWGTVSELGEGSFRLTNSNEASAFHDIVVNLSEETIFLDAVSGARRTAADLKEGQVLYAYVSSMMTRSLPPQAAGRLVLCNLPSDFSAPHYAQVRKVETGEDGGIDVLTSDDVILHLNRETKLLSSVPGATVSLADLKPGSMVLSWYQVVALSMPAQAAPTQVMLFPYGYRGYVAAQPGSLSVNGTALDLTEGQRPFVHEGKLMVPVRRLAEALGYSVHWDAKTTTVTVEREGKTLYTFTPGADTLVVADGAEWSVALPAQLNNGVTFLSLDDLLVLQEIKYESSSVFG